MAKFHMGAEKVLPPHVVPRYPGGGNTGSAAAAAQGTSTTGPAGRGEAGSRMAPPRRIYDSAPWGPGSPGSPFPKK
jgi:hypothetical protein